MDNGLSIESVTGAVRMKKYSTAINTDADQDKGYLDFDSYLKVLTAQMSNQDLNNPMSDSEFMQQMASYSMMEVMDKMNKQSVITYATSLIGKAVTVSDGTKAATGVIDSVVIDDGKASLLINGTKYSTDQITDVVDTDSYRAALSLAGKKVNVTEDGEIIKSGKVDDVVFKDGAAYAVINSEPYDLSLVSLADSENAAKELSLSEEEYNDADVITDNTAVQQDNMQTAEVGLSDAASGFYADTGTVNDTYVSSNSTRSRDTLPFPENSVPSDAPGGVAAAAEELSRIASGMYRSDTEEQYRAEQGIDFDPARLSARIVSREAEDTAPDDETVYRTARVLEMKGSVENAAEEEGVLYSAKDGSEYDMSGVGTVYQSDSSIITPTANAAYSASLPDGLYYSYNGKMVELKHGYNPYTSNVIQGQNKFYSDSYWQNRPFSEEYPEEAALANAYGTKMYDIRYIHNTDITKQIKKAVIGYAANGKAFTDIGFSGVGQIGEVITWADGTQRVEVIGDNGSVCYTTSGRYTLDEICDFSRFFSGNTADMNSGIPYLTSQEMSIRKAAMQITPAMQSELNAYESQIVNQARYYTSSL